MAEPQPAKWTEEKILQHLKEIAEQQLNMSPEQMAAIDMDASLLDALQLDSLAQVVLVTTIEQDFGCAFSLEQWQQMGTVRDLVRMISERLVQESLA
jgi:acyl carrier protein